MRFSSQFQTINACEQTITGNVNYDGAVLTIQEKDEKDCRLYFSNKDELITLIEMLSEMHKRMED